MGRAAWGYTPPLFFSFAHVIQSVRLLKMNFLNRPLLGKTGWLLSFEAEHMPCQWLKWLNYMNGHVGLTASVPLSGIFKGKYTEDGMRNLHPQITSAGVLKRKSGKKRWKFPNLVRVLEKLKWCWLLSKHLWQSSFLFKISSPGEEGIPWRLRTLWDYLKKNQKENWGHAYQLRGKSGSWKLFHACCNTSCCWFCLYSYSVERTPKTCFDYMGSSHVQMDGLSNFCNPNHIISFITYNRCFLNHGTWLPDTACALVSRMRSLRISSISSL